MFQTKDNVLGIVELVTGDWPKEQKERLLRELAAAEKEKEQAEIVATTMRLYL